MAINLIIADLIFNLIFDSIILIALAIRFLKIRNLSVVNLDKFQNIKNKYNYIIVGIRLL